jgi:7-carboxy-7-deazaguanine synthase
MTLKHPPLRPVVGIDLGREWRNQQPPEPRVQSLDGGELDLHSMFFTIQGEGPFSGRRAIFVRLAGCNLQCPSCDTEYTQGRERLFIGQIASRVQGLAYKNRAITCLVVITGGEPFRQPIGLLCSMLLQRGFTVQIETNGMLEPDPAFVSVFDLQAGADDRLHIVVSPKTNRIHPTTARMALAFKYVLDAHSVDPRDGLPIQALEHPSKRVARPPEDFAGEIIVTPMETGDKDRDLVNIKAAADVCMAHGYRLNLQIHKYVGVP